MHIVNIVGIMKTWQSKNSKTFYMRTISEEFSRYSMEQQKLNKLKKT